MNRDEVSNTILEIITSRITFKYDGINEEATFEDLGFDSLDTLETAFLIEEEFDVNIFVDKMKDMNKVSDLIDYVYASILNRR